MQTTPPPASASTTSPSLDADAYEFELSVVMPCLNEADTLEVCIEKAKKAMAEHGIHGEIVISDNGSEDGSLEIARRCGARIVNAPERGYGAALLYGIASARGRYVIMGDADDSYDFLEIPKFVDRLREGHDLVQGCRLPGGGGTVLPGAMPFLHRWIGNPMFTRLVRSWFGAPINDVYCGLRGFTKTHYDSLNQRCKGMEFATEMIIKSSLYKADIAEVPITLHPDGRIAHAPHLRTFRDGWHTLRFFLMYSPRSLFFAPGLLLMLAGVVAAALGWFRVPIASTNFDAHTLLFGSLFIICGYQAVAFGALTKIFAINHGFHPGVGKLGRVTKGFNLEWTLVLSLIAILVGGGFLFWSALSWKQQGFGALNYSDTMHVVIPSMTLVVIGVQSIFSGFFAQILGMSLRRTADDAAARARVAHSPSGPHPTA